jgi:hypothetical protein
MKSSIGWSARATAIGVVLLVSALFLAVAGSTSGLAQSPDATSAPEATQAPATDAPATDAPAGDATTAPDGSEGDSSGDGFPTWGWILIAGALGLAVLALMAFFRGGSRDANAGQTKWHSSALDAYASSAAIRDVIASNLSADGLGDSPEVKERRWEGARRRIDDRAAELHTLEARTDDPAASGLVKQLIADLSALRSAVDSHLSLISRGDGADLSAEQVAQSESLVKERLAQFDTSLDAFKAYVDKSR